MAQPDSANTSSQPVRLRQPENLSWADLAAREAAALTRIDKMEEYELYQAHKRRDEPGYEHRKRAIKARFDRRRDQVRAICQSYRMELSSEMPRVLPDPPPLERPLDLLNHGPESDHAEIHHQRNQPEPKRSHRPLDR